MKKIILASLIAFTLSIACKKENKNSIPDDNTSNPTLNAFSILTGTKWKQTHDYYDTTAYAGAHLTQWPLSSTSEFIHPYDTCELTSKVWWRPDNTLWIIKGQGCDALMPDTENIGVWSLSSNNAYYINSDNDTMNVLELNNNYFKLWYKSVVTNSANIVVETDYTIWVFEPTN